MYDILCRGDIMAFKNKARMSEYQNSYIKQTYDRVNLTLPKGDKIIVKAHAAGQNESVNAFINRAISEQIVRDNLKKMNSGAAPK